MTIKVFPFLDLDSTKATDSIAVERKPFANVAKDLVSMTFHDVQNCS